MSAEYTFADLYRRFSQLLRRGNVHSVQAKPPRCRVTFGTDPITGDEHTTDWLLWYSNSDSERQDWRMPAIGSPAMVLSVGGETGGGIVFPGLMTDDQTPPSDNPNQHVTKYSDGAVMTYDSAAHEATVNLPAGGKVLVVAAGGIELQANTKIVGNLEVTGDSTVAGNSQVDGNITAGGDISDKYGTVNQIRVVYNGHTHNENGDGGGITDSPNQPLSAYLKRRKARK